MKKIPTLFIREFDGHKIKGITDQVTPGLEWVLEGDGIPTVKWDGACCAFLGGRFYKRYDAKKGRKPPAGAIPCCDPDPVTGHWPHWVPVDMNNPADRWFLAAYGNYGKAPDWTYEAVCPHFQGNPYGLTRDILVRHGVDEIDDLDDRSLEGIREYLTDHNIEGIVFWLNGEPRCKIKRTDFGLEWPVTIRGDQP